MAERRTARALLVEHDPSLRRTLTLALETIGFDVDALPSGDLALERLSGELLALAVIEARLPGVLSGVETLEAIKLQLPSLPVVLLVDQDRPQDLLAAFHAGAADVLLKPFELAELRTALGRSLAARGPVEVDALDFHARVELAKTALAAGALDVAEAHLRGALARDPLDAEVLNLLGVVLELRGDFSTATRAYRAAFGSDPHYGRARRNLERLSDLSAYVGLAGDARAPATLEGTTLRLAVPLADPPRDLGLVRLAKRAGGPTCGVAVGVLLDPPSADERPVRLVAQRGGFVRPVGRFDACSVPCVLSYLLATDPVTATVALRSSARCDATLVGAWWQEGAIAKLREGGTVLVAGAAELPPVTTVRPDLDGPDPVRVYALGLAAHLAASERAELLLPSLALANDLAADEGPLVASLPVTVIFERLGLAPVPPWLPRDLFVAVRLPREGDTPLVVGPTEDAFLRIC